MRGHGFATFGFWLGIIASVSGNVAHSYAGNHPPVGAVVSDGFWPVALLVSLEVISRVQWPKGWYWWFTRYAGLTAVAVIAAVVSYRHMSGLLAFYGEDSFSAHLGPLAVDGLMVVCSVALLAIADNARRDVHKTIDMVDNSTTMSTNLASPDVYVSTKYTNSIYERQNHLNHVHEMVLPLREATNQATVISVAQEPLPEITAPAATAKPQTLSRYAEAHKAYQASVEAGTPLTGKQMGELFGRSSRWGRSRIIEAREQS